MKIMVSPASRDPLYIQIYDAIVKSIASGELSPGDILPSTRKLAADLHINHITVNKAYALLESEGFAYSNNKRIEVLNPSDTARKEFIQRWKNTENLMITEAKAKKIPESEMRKMFKDIMESL